MGINYHLVIFIYSLQIHGSPLASYPADINVVEKMRTVCTLDCPRITNGLQTSYSNIIITSLLDPLCLHPPVVKPLLVHHFLLLRYGF